MPCHVPTCPTRPGPSGFCALHQNWINARANGNAKHMTVADRIAIAAHPGWRGRKWRRVSLMWPAGLYFHVDPPGGMGEDFPTAAEALAELDRKNGVTPAADVARLEAELRRYRNHLDDIRCDILDTGRALGDDSDPELTPRRLVREVLAELAAIRTHRDALEERRRELAEDNDVMTGDMAWLELLADRLRAALDKQAATVANLTSELAERERDVTDLCAERDAYAADLEVARQTALADADTIDNLRTGVGHLETALTLARRPWWRKVWAWVTGGGE